MNETSIDGKQFNENTENSSTSSKNDANPGNRSAANNIPAFNPNDLYYNMSGKKYLLIFNHKKYQKTKYFKGQPPVRNGTDEDVKSLKTVFEELSFKVLTYTDKTYDEIMTILGNVSTQNHIDTSCLCVIILTHGDERDDVFANDRPYRLQDVMSKFESGHITLVNKPKLFIVQACRGERLDAGRTVMYDGEHASTLTIPSHADFLIMRSTVEGFVSWREGVLGSWMIQTLCQIIKENHESMDLLQMITLVNKRVAYEKASNTPYNKSFHNKKQVPETRFTLTKFLKL